MRCLIDNDLNREFSNAKFIMDYGECIWVTKFVMDKFLMDSAFESRLTNIPITNFKRTISFSLGGQTSGLVAFVLL